MDNDREELGAWGGMDNYLPEPQQLYLVKSDRSPNNKKDPSIPLNEQNLRNDNLKSDGTNHNHEPEKSESVEKTPAEIFEANELKRIKEISRVEMPQLVSYAGVIPMPDGLKEIMSCSFCQKTVDPMNGKVTRCEAGHYVCVPCSSYLPVCPRPDTTPGTGKNLSKPCFARILPPQRSSWYTNLYNNTILRCPHNSQGCPVTVKRRAFEDHLSMCEYRFETSQPRLNVANKDGVQAETSGEEVKQEIAFSQKSEDFYENLTSVRNSENSSENVALVQNSEYTAEDLASAQNSEYKAEDMQRRLKARKLQLKM